MVKLILTFILGILLVGTLWAGGVLTRQSDIPSGEKTLLVGAGLTDVQVGELRCYDTYCMFWINGKGINTEQRIEKSKEVSTLFFNKTSNQDETIYSTTLKTNEEMLTERDKIVDSLLSQIAGQIETKSRASASPVIGESEKVVIGSKVIGEKA